MAWSIRVTVRWMHLVAQSKGKRHLRYWPRCTGCFFPESDLSPRGLAGSQVLGMYLCALLSGWFIEELVGVYHDPGVHG